MNANKWTLSRKGEGETHSCKDTGDPHIQGVGSTSPPYFTRFGPGLFFTSNLHYSSSSPFPYNFKFQVHCEKIGRHEKETENGHPK
ncbi:hypothetical protein ACTXT7_003304 [Hymenolepis weldensis]